MQTSRLSYNRLVFSNKSSPHRVKLAYCQYCSMVAQPKTTNKNDNNTISFNMKIIFIFLLIIGFCSMSTANYLKWMLKHTPRDDWNVFMLTFPKKINSFFIFTTISFMIISGIYFFYFKGSFLQFLLGVISFNLFSKGMVSSIWNYGRFYQNHKRISDNEELYQSARSIFGDSMEREHFISTELYNSVYLKKNEYLVKLILSLLVSVLSLILFILNVNGMF